MDPSLALADLALACPVHGPWGSRFFRFDMQNIWNVTASGVHVPPPYEVHAPLWEILDPPLSSHSCSLIRKELAKVSEMALDFFAEFRQFDTNKKLSAKITKFSEFLQWQTTWSKSLNFVILTDKCFVNWASELSSKIVAENSAKKTCPFCLNLSFLSQNAVTKITSLWIRIFGKMSQFFLNSNFWKYCLNSDEISKFRVFVTDNFGQIVWMCFVS